MKHYPSGFVPINFQSVGKMLLVIGVVAALIKGIDTLFELFGLSNFILPISVACVCLGAYLVFVVPKDK